MIRPFLSAPVPVHKLFPAHCFFVLSCAIFLLITLLNPVVAAALDRPVGVTPKGNGVDPRPVFIWKSVAEATEYRLWIKQSTQLLVNQRIDATTANCVVGGDCSLQPDISIQPNKSLRWKVRAFNETDRSHWSVTERYTLKGPKKPRTVAPRGKIDIAQPAFQWRTVEGALNYELQVIGDGNSFAGLTQAVTADVAACADDNICELIPDVPLENGDYRFRVRAESAVAYGKWSNYRSFQVHNVMTSLSQPQNLTASAGDAQVMLSWDVVDGADGYAVCVAQAMIIDALNCTAAEGLGVPLVAGTNSILVDDTVIPGGLDNGVEYFFVVQATAEANGSSIYSEASPEVSAIPQGEDTGEVTVILPPAIDYPNWYANPPQIIAEPAMGRAVIDPDSGYKIWRLGGSASEMHAALAYPDSEEALTPQHKQHFYSRIVATNKDETYAFGSGGHKGDYAAMWRMADKKLVQWVPTGKRNNVDYSLDHFAMRGLFWDQNHNNVYWYTDAYHLMRATIDFENYHVTTEVWDSFPEYDYITIGLGEGEFSDDGTKLVLVGSERNGDATPETIIAYEVNTKRQVGTRIVAPYQGNSLNWAGVDPTGQYLVFDMPENIQDRGGIWTWVVPWNQIDAEPRLVYTHKKHSDFVIDNSGIPWLVYGNYQGVFAASLDKTFIKRVWPVFDTSPVDNPGHSAYAGFPHENGNGHVSRVANLPGMVLLGRNEHAGFYFVNIDDPGVIRHIGNARNGGVSVHGETVGDNRYLREPRASASNSGRYIFFVTDYLYDGSVHDPNMPYENRSYLNMVELETAKDRE